MFEFLNLEFLANLLGVGSVVAAATATTYRYMESKTLQWVYVRLVVDGNVHTWVRMPRQAFTRAEITALVAKLSIDQKSRADLGFIDDEFIYVAIRKRERMLDIPLTAEQAHPFRAKGWVENPED